MRARVCAGSERRAARLGPYNRGTMPDATPSSAAPHAPRWPLAIVFVCALGLRIAVHLEVADGPIPWLHRYGESDMAFHHAHAERLSQGDWLQRGPFHPCHAWHRDVARAHFLASPTARERYASAPDPVVALWDDWYGGARFHQEPLYPYLVAIGYAWLGADPGWMIVLQLILGAASQVLVFAIARRHAGTNAAWAAVVVSLAYAPTIAHELVLLRTAVEVFLGLATVASADRARVSARPGSWLLVGSIAGIATVCRAPLALLALGVGLLAARAGARSAAAYAAGVALALAPVAARNVAVGAPVASLSSVAAVTFACQNVPGVDPLGGFTVDAPAVAAAMGEGDGAFFASARASWARHPDAGSIVWMLAGRARALVANREIAGNTSVELARRESRVLAACPIGFGVIAALAAIGLALGMRRGGRPWPLVALIVAAAVPQLAFYVTSRFRSPLALALLPCAGAGVVALASAARARCWRRLAGACGLGAAIAIAAHCAPDERHLAAAELATAHEVYYLPAWEAARARGDHAEAIAVTERALGLGARELAALDLSNGSLTGDERDHAWVALGWTMRLASARAAAGDATGASRAIDAAARLEARLGRSGAPDTRDR